MTEARLVAVCSSPQRLTRKQNVGEGKLLEDWGLEGDAHTGKWHRQISLLAEESIQKARTRWGLDVSYGDFAENLTTRGISLISLPIGARLQIGPEVILEITQKGKKCHTGCQILKITGKCIFPLEGIFGKVLRSGMVRSGDSIAVLREVPTPV